MAQKRDPFLGPSPQTRHAVCAVFGCRNTERSPFSFHPLPQDPDRCSQWLTLINRRDLAGKLRSGPTVVCSAHFLPELMNNGILLPNALPSLFLPTTKHQFVLDGDPFLGPSPQTPHAVCAVFGCRNTERSPFSFHPLPQDPDRCSQWLTLINRRDLAGKLRSGPTVVCSAHFLPEQTNNGILLPNALPSLFLATTKHQFVLDGDPFLGPSPQTPHAVCAVFGCRNTERSLFSFHPLPQDPDRCSQWLTLINRRDLAGKLRSGPTVVCSAHFLPEQMNNGILLPNALPSLFLPTTKHQFVLDGDPFLGPSPQTRHAVCAVFGCRNTERSPFSFHPLPQDPDRRSQWLTLINRRDLAGKLRSGPTAVCSAHFLPELMNNGILLPNALPSLFLPTTKHQFVLDDSFSQLPTPRSAETIPTLLASRKRKIEITPHVPEHPESTNPAHPVNTSTQTDRREAFYRHATFSGVEQVNIPSTGNPRSVQAQTDPELMEVFTAELRQKLEKDLQEAQELLHIAENPHIEKTKFIKECDKHLDEKIANFVKSHAYLYNKFDGKEYPEDFKLFALKLYLWNPKCYKFFEKFFDLPTKDAIKKFRLPVKSGANQNLMESLKVKIDQMSILARHCVVCFDAIRIKKSLYYDLRVDYLCGFQEIDGVVGQELAEYALLISLRGLFTKWKQPASFALVSKKGTHTDIQSWLNKTIENLLEMGLNVKALVTNMDEEFLEAPKESYFTIKEVKVYHIFDVPDLLKIARNELMHKDFLIGNDVVKWEYVVEVYDTDKTQELKLLSNLTENHVRPNATSMNDIEIAKQVFNSDIAATMHFYIISGLHTEEAKSTVQFMKKMKGLYEILYSRRLINAYRSTSVQNKFLKESIEYFRTIQVKDKRRNVTKSKFVSGLMFTIESMKLLAADLKMCSVHYLLTKNISKDFTVDYFKSQIETAIAFTRRFRRLFLSNILNNTKNTATGEDVMGTLLKISEYVNEDMNKNEDTNKDLNIGVKDYRIEWPSNEYIAGYLLHKCLEKHICDNIVQNICDYYKFEERSSDVLLETFRFYNVNNVNKICKVRPPVQIREFVIQMEKRFNEYLSSPSRDNLNFGWNLYRIIEQDSFKMPCQCFPDKFLRMLYIRLKIYSSVKEYNKTNRNKR